MKFYLVVNPVSGGGKGNAIATKFVENLVKNDELGAIFYTAKINDFHNMLPKIVKKIKRDNYKNYRLVIIGGDGTFSEVVCELVKNNVELPISYYPAGTGNDFNREIKQEENIEKWLKHQKSLETAKVLEFLDIKSGFDSRKVAINSIGIGIDADVCHSVEKSNVKELLNKVKLGKYTYLTLLLKHLPIRKDFSCNIKLGDEKKFVENVLLMNIANHGYFGGGIKIAPQAKQNNHSMTLVILQNDKIRKLIPAALKLLNKKKDHFEHRLFSYYETNKLELELLDKVNVQIDGEPLYLENNKIVLELATYPLWY